MKPSDIRELARLLIEREQPLIGEYQRTLANARTLHSVVKAAREAFEEETRREGLDQLRLELTEVESDAKNIRNVQFYLRRGRWAAVFVAMSANRFRLVGPFKTGGEEGPCEEGEMNAANRDALILDRIGELIDQGFAVRPPKKSG